MGLVEFAFVNETVVAGKLGNLHLRRENTRGTCINSSNWQVDIPVRASQTFGVKTCCRINHLPGQFKLNQSVPPAAAF